MYSDSSDFFPVIRQDYIINFLVQDFKSIRKSYKESMKKKVRGCIEAVHKSGKLDDQ